jgi:hypothetical protein
VNDDLVGAIADKRLVEFVYKTGCTRIVERHDYGSRCEVDRLLTFQIGGDSQSGASHGRKEFDIDQIRHLRTPGPSVSLYTGRERQHHRTWDTLFGRVTGSRPVLRLKSTLTMRYRHRAWTSELQDSR